MIPRSGLLENISAHSVIRSSILVLTCWCVFCLGISAGSRRTRVHAHTRSFASRNNASVKLREASSLCILMPQFWERAFASLMHQAQRPFPDHESASCAHLQCIQLHISITMRQTLDHRRYGRRASGSKSIAVSSSHPGRCIPILLCLDLIDD